MSPLLTKIKKQKFFSRNFYFPEKFLISLPIPVIKTPMGIAYLFMSVKSTPTKGRHKRTPNSVTSIAVNFAI